MAPAKRDAKKKKKDGGSKQEQEAAGEGAGAAAGADAELDPEKAAKKVGPGRHAGCCGTHGGALGGTHCAVGHMGGPEGREEYLSRFEGRAPVPVMHAGQSDIPTSVIHSAIFFFVRAPSMLHPSHP